MMLYGLANCSTTTNAYNHLIARGFEVTLIDYRDNPLTLEQLTTYFAQSNQPIIAWLNTSGQAYRTRKEQLANQLPEVILSVIANEPMILKRPLLVSHHTVQAGYRKEFYDAL